MRRRFTTKTLNPEAVWQINHSIKTARFFEITSKRRKGFPSETRVKRGLRIVHGEKELQEKLGRNDPCPCGSGRSFQKLLPAFRSLRRQPTESLLPRVTVKIISNFEPVRSESGSPPESSCIMLFQSRFESALG